MSQNDDYDRFFQTTDTLESQARRSAKSSNAHGRPIRLASKLSAVALDQISVSASSSQASRVYVAGSDGCVRRVKIGAKQQGAVDAGKAGGKAGADEVDLVLSGPKTPLTCLCVGYERDEHGMLVLVYAGAWDKTIWRWAVRGDELVGKPLVFRNGHSDFVKSIAVFRPRGCSTDILVSGSADKSLCFWLATPSGTASPILQLKNHHKTSVNCVLAREASQHGEADRDHNNVFSVFSGSSDGEVVETEVVVKTSGESNTEAQTVELTGNKQAVTVHPTTVYSIAWHGDMLDLLTASADGSVRIMTCRDTESKFPPWELESELKHGGHVRCVASQTEEGASIYTGGRDESINLWDNATGKVACTFDGHFDEVTGIVADGQHAQARAISVSLDGTVRVWDSQEVERIRQGPQEEDKPVVSGVELTAEEEAELAALMEDSD